MSYRDSYAEWDGFAYPPPSPEMAHLDVSVDEARIWEESASAGMPMRVRGRWALAWDIRWYGTWASMIVVFLTQEGAAAHEERLRQRTLAEKRARLEARLNALTREADVIRAEIEGLA